MAKKTEKKTAKSKSESTKKASGKKTEGTAPKKKTSSIKYLSGLLFKKMAFGGAKELSSNADEVNKLNVFPVPDGDTGDNMRMTIESGISAIESTESDNLADVMKSLSQGMLLGARGNSGVILSQFFAGLSRGLETSEKADATTFGSALELAVEQAYSSVMTPTEGTILTVAREAVEFAVARINPKSTIRSLFSDLVNEMHRSLERTPEILAVLKEAGVVDSGAAGLFYIMDGFNRVLNGKEIFGGELPSPTGDKKRTEAKFVFDRTGKMSYGYCTEFLLQLQDSKTDVDNFDVDSLKAFLSELGDSIVAFKNDSIVKVHVHTFTPERVIEYGRRYGEFLTIKIENMSVQHSELSDSSAEVNTEPDVPKKRYGVVAVCNGEGIQSLYHDLGTDVTITGGQTHNPSTSDFIEAFDKISAENIFVFPNNGNIFMAAQQAAEMYEKARVLVIPSKNIGTGYVALSSLNFECEDIDSVVADMQSAMMRVTAGYVSPSIRDADMNGIHIKNGDTIGIIDKEIVLCEEKRCDASRKLASMLLELPEKFMLTVFSGIDASEEETQALMDSVRVAYPSAEVYLISGGQEIYPYIFVAE